MLINVGQDILIGGLFRLESVRMRRLKNDQPELRQILMGLRDVIAPGSL